MAKKPDNRATLAACKARLKKIAAILKAVDERFLAADGPVTTRRLEITHKELRRIYKLAKG